MIMASISTNKKTGAKRVAFVGCDGVRRSIYLGPCNDRVAREVQRPVESIVSAAAADVPVDPRTGTWLTKISDAMHEKFVNAGLVVSRTSQVVVTLGAFLDEYLKRRTDAKASTHLFFGHTARNLRTFFGESRPLASITPAEADDFRRWISTTEKLSPSTVARRCSLARTYFRDALRRRLIDGNPFADIGGGPKSNPERQRFIDRTTISKVIEACPNAAWRALVALSRFGGLRVPSEALILRWGDINWAEDRMTIRSPKTEHHPGKASRVCPLFPEVRQYLDELHSLAPDGAVFILEALRPTGSNPGDCNLRTGLERIIDRAGVQAWPKLWHNMRSSRQTELTEEFPSHVVTSWMGNSERIADRHYLQVLDSHFKKAARPRARAVSESTRNDAHGEPGNEKTPGIPRVSAIKVGDTGLEPVTSIL